MNREILNNYIKNNQINNLTNYLSNYLNLHKEKLYIKFINNFQTNSITIDNSNEFVIILNNSIHDEIIVNNTKFEETLLINDTSNILINTKLTYIDITYILIQNVTNYNSKEIIESYFESDNIILINDKNLIDDKTCDLIKNFIDSSIHNKNYIKYDINKSYNVKSDSLKLNKQHNIVNSNIFLIKKYDEIIFDIIGKIIKYLNLNYNYINCTGDSGYKLERMFGEIPIYVSKNDDLINKDDSINKDLKLTIMNIIICLNQDYEGGEICFPKQNKTIKMKKGDILLYPPYWTHPIYSNDLLNKTYKYTITTSLY